MRTLSSIPETAKIARVIAFACPVFRDMYVSQSPVPVDLRSMEFPYLESRLKELHLLQMIRSHVGHWVGSQNLAHFDPAFLLNVLMEPKQIHEP